MRKTLAVLIVLLMITLFTTTIAFAKPIDPTINLSTAVNDAGKDVTLKVWLSSNPEVRTFSFLLKYNAEELTYKDYYWGSSTQGVSIYPCNCTLYAPGVIRISFISTNVLLDISDLIDITFTVKSNLGPGYTTTPIEIAYEGAYNGFNTLTGLLKPLVDAVNNGTVTVSPLAVNISNEEKKAGGDVTLKVWLNNNPELRTFSFILNYDIAELTYKDYYWGSSTEGVSIYPRNCTLYAPGVIRISFTTTSAFSDVSDLINITFTVKSNLVPGYKTTPIEIFYDGSYNGFNTNTGIQKPPIDVNNNGTVTVVQQCEHNYIGEITFHTKEVEGYTTFTCSICGDSYIGPLPDVIYGDVNNNGIIGFDDAGLLVNHLMGTVILTDPIMLLCADVNKDGVIGFDDIGLVLILLGFY